MTIVYPVGKGLYVNLTNRCPCACTFCIRQNGAGVYGSDSLWLEREPTVEEVVGALESAGLSTCAEVVFCGYGEPTERLDDLLAVARRIRSLAPKVPIRVNTNGLADLIAGGPTAARFEGLVDTLSISLNAPTAEEYERLCRPKFGAAAYEAMLRFAAEAKRFVPAVVLSVVGTADMTPEKVAACREVCDRIGVPLRVRVYSPPERAVATPLKTAVRALLAGALAFGSLAAPAVNTASVKSAFADKVEALAEKMLPQKEVNEMLGFFGPVTKKYMPVFQKFNTEYLSSTNKLATVRKYLPKADAALAEARSMKVPKRFENQKATYLARLETFLSITKFTMKFGQ